ncbi:MAG: class I SAM-dependent methyltransferase, partial [Oscillospiraceae bacterium]
MDGTGEISIRLAKKGYDVLSVDLSSQMLEILNDKRTEIKKPIKLQLIHQDITALDLFGTIDGAVSTFDTLNHLNPSQFDA